MPIESNDHIAIKVENVSKRYRVGVVSARTFKDDLQQFLFRLFGKGSSIEKHTADNDRTTLTTSDYVWSLKDINFEIQKGDIVGIIGKNGAGKSTLLKILSRITTPTTGEIKINGRIASLLEVGTGFHPELTGRENIYLNGSILGMTRKEIDQKLNQIIEFAEVQRYIDTPVKRYSSGMYVRLAFSIAAHLDPDILIIDEVLSVGDSEFQKKCLRKMKDVSAHGRTILFVSHSIPSLQNLCSHGIVIQNGQLTTSKIKIEDALKCYLESQTNSTSIIISDRKDRKGNGKLKFTDCKLIDCNQKDIRTLVSGQEVTFRLFFETQKNVSLKNVSVAISIKSSNGTLISVFCNDYVDKKFTEIQNVGYFDCTIFKLPLMEDLFTLNIMANDSTEILDWIEDAVQINVENGDFFGSGKITELTHKSVLIDHKWNIQ
jgi:lipopolysaccharide transport system ATP-binding protein